MSNQVRTILPLVLLSAVLLSIPWLVPHCGFFALVGFVPLLWAEHLASERGVKRFWGWIYLCFVLWNAATVWWVANATVGGAVFAVLANALQMAVIWWPFRLFKKRFGGILPYIFLAVLWIAWERWYLQSAEISFPWLVLGNAFAQSTRCIQWYEFTGTLGGSLWVWVCNISIFLCLKGVRRPLRTAFFAWTAAVLAFPFAASAHLYHYYKEKSEDSIKVLIAQPNFDPYEKFESLSQDEQNAVLLGIYEKAMQGDSTWTGLLIAPETFTGDVVLNDIAAGNTFRTFQDFLSKHPGANLLFGASTYRIYPQVRRPAPVARKINGGWSVSHNSAIMTDTSGRADVFHKSKLVVGTELTPYPKIFVPLDDKLGGVMGRCVGQKRISCLPFIRDGSVTKIGVPVCYESIYGEYCTGYIKAGARALAVITNDAWWGDTPGYRQHLSYSRLRAIETRRDIARCANTGISAIIDQRGDLPARTSWWQEDCIEGEINLNSASTFFVRHGDIAGRSCVVIALIVALLWLLSAFSGRKFLLSR
ncbi:MAG: apolipoprotein N-acyltransferase [Bacteroidales bacterium]|nr:apolipoprotein N-acyltransferase [Bacteroidales bacterium]